MDRGLDEGAIPEFVDGEPTDVRRWLEMVINRCWLSPHIVVWRGICSTTPNRLPP